MNRVKRSHKLFKTFKYKIKLIYFIIQVNNAITFKFGIKLEWKEVRATYHNLKIDSSYNALSGEEMNKLNDQLKDEEGWSNAVQRQLDAIRKDNDSLNKDRFEAIAKVSGIGGLLNRAHRTSTALIGRCLKEARDR